jgi:hypothetical protein
MHRNGGKRDAEDRRPILFLRARSRRRNPGLRIGCRLPQGRLEIGPSGARLAHRMTGAGGSARGLRVVRRRFREMRGRSGTSRRRGNDGCRLQGARRRRLLLLGHILFDEERTVHGHIRRDRARVDRAQGIAYGRRGGLDGRAGACRCDLRRHHGGGSRTEPSRKHQSHAKRGDGGDRHFDHESPACPPGPSQQRCGSTITHEASPFRAATNESGVLCSHFDDEMVFARQKGEVSSKSVPPREKWRERA